MESCLILHEGPLQTVPEDADLGVGLRARPEQSAKPRAVQRHPHGCADVLLAGNSWMPGTGVTDLNSKEASKITKYYQNNSQILSQK